MTDRIWRVKMKKLLIGLCLGLLFIPAVAQAAEIRVSGFLAPFLFIVVICLLAGLALWAIDTWTPEMAKVWAKLPKILKFIVVVIAVIWVIMILAGLVGIRIT